jgi:hypothetical protein
MDENDPDLDHDDHDDDDDDDRDGPARRRRLTRGGRLAAGGAVAVLAVAGLALALTAGGGGGGDGSGGGGSAGEPTSGQDAALEYAACMRENGVEDFPDPEGDGGFGEGGLAPEDMSPQERGTYEEAAGTCEAIRGDTGEEGGEPLGGEEVAERQDAALAMARCMRDRGWDMPDPEVSEDGSIGIRGIEMLEPGDPDFGRYAEDQSVCFEEAGLPAPGGGS